MTDQAAACRSTLTRLAFGGAAVFLLACAVALIGSEVGFLGRSAMTRWFGLGLLGASLGLAALSGLDHLKGTWSFRGVDVSRRRHPRAFRLVILLSALGSLGLGILGVLMIKTISP